jgi:hypothetical protein
MNFAALIQQLSLPETPIFAMFLRTGEGASTPSPALTTRTVGAARMADGFLNLPGEIWKPVPWAPDYTVSTFGRVRSIRPRKGARANVNGGVLAPWVNSPRRGVAYRRLRVSLRVAKKTTTYSVHTLVLETFVGPRPPGCEACHNDGNGLNNTLSNLRWATHTENVADSVKHGTKTAPPRLCGQQHHNATLTNEQVREIRTTPFKKGMQTAWARQYGVSTQTIRRLRRGVSRADA